MLYIEKLLSIKNKNVNDKVYKIITLFGIKIKIRNKVKEIHLNENKLLSYQKSIKDNIEINFAKNFKYKNTNCLINNEEYFNNILLFDYKFINIYNSWGVNLGDYIQTLAVENIINTHYPNIQKSYIDRDSLSAYDGKPAFTIMQGWFAHDYNFLPNNRIYPIYVGTHITQPMKEFLVKFVNYNPLYFKNKVIGCRDKETQEFFNELGVENYLSRCLTLTLPKREELNTQKKVFIVNFPENYYDYIPKSIIKNAIFVNQRCVDGKKNINEYLNIHNKYFHEAEEQLNIYKKEAKLVITTALHCASPCVAMGIPVILVNPYENDSRYSALDGIIDIYSIEELKKRKIDYDVKTADIESLKVNMIKNLNLTIMQAKGEEVTNKEILNVREKISNFNITNHE